MKSSLHRNCPALGLGSSLTSSQFTIIQGSNPALSKFSANPSPKINSCNVSQHENVFEIQWFDRPPDRAEELQLALATGAFQVLAMRRICGWLVGLAQNATLFDAGGAIIDREIEA
jgi:hypothetical protein